MIKILEIGNPDTKKSKTIYTMRCTWCECKFEFEESDCNQVVREKRLNGAIDAAIFCPCCLKTNFRNLRDLVQREVLVDDLSTNEDTFKVHPEYEPIYKRDVSDMPVNDLSTNKDTFKVDPEHESIYNKNNIGLDYYGIHIDKCFDSSSILPDDYTNYISKINSIDNYKLPDDYKIDTIPMHCKGCPNWPCTGGSDYKDDHGIYTNCVRKPNYQK